METLKCGHDSLDGRHGGDLKYENGRPYVHACQLIPGDVVRGGYVVESVLLERPDVVIRYVGLDRDVIRNAATRIDLEEVGR